VLDDFGSHGSASSPSTLDPFQPFDGLPFESRNVLTLRAIFVGLLCGGLVNASNIYLGLKSGWTAGANIFGVRTHYLIHYLLWPAISHILGQSIVGFAVLKSCSVHLSNFPILGGGFGPREASQVTLARSVSYFLTVIRTTLRRLSLRPQVA